MKQEIYEKAHKLKALAERGEAGERENAMELLVQFLESNGHTLADMEAKEMEVIEWKYIYEDDTERRLLSQAAAWAGVDLYVYGYKGLRKGSKDGRTRIAKGTVVAIENMKLHFFAWLDALKTEFEVTLTAFIHKNNIFPEPSDTEERPARRELTEVERRAILRMQGMTRTVVRKTLKA